MDYLTFIFTGRSGCGKGTQVRLLEEYLQKNDPEKKIFYLQTGQYFREFIKKEGYTQKLSRDVNEVGGRQPDFLAIWIWSQVFIDNIKNEEHLLIDGSPRSLSEAKSLDTALKFYKREKPFFIHLNVSREESERRLLDRGKKEGRSDDIDIADVRRRLDWFEEDVMPAVDFYRNSPDYTFIEVDGEQSVEDIHKEIIQKVFSK